MTDLIQRFIDFIMDMASPLGSRFSRGCLWWICRKQLLEVLRATVILRPKWVNTILHKDIILRINEYSSSMPLFHQASAFPETLQE